MLLEACSDVSVVRDHDIMSMHLELKQKSVKDQKRSGQGGCADGGGDHADCRPMRCKTESGHGNCTRLFLQTKLAVVLKTGMMVVSYDAMSLMAVMILMALEVVLGLRMRHEVVLLALGNLDKTLRLESSL